MKDKICLVGLGHVDLIELEEKSKLTLRLIRTKTQEYDTLKQEIESLKQEAKNMDRNLL